MTRKIINIAFLIISIALIINSCENDKLPIRIVQNNKEKCDCDTTKYRDCDCDTLDPIKVVCDCDTSPYRDCDCDTMDIERPAPCVCDTTPYRDCDCDTNDPIDICPCNVTPFNDPDCPCDDNQPSRCDCDSTGYKDFNCGCDNDTKPYPCNCDKTKYKDPDCWCDPDKEEAPQPISFKNEIYPILERRCNSCHSDGGGTPVLFTNSDAYNIANYVTPYQPENSDLITRYLNITMPQSGEIVPDNEVKLIIQWIKEGANNK